MAVALTPPSSEPVAPRLADLVEVEALGGDRYRALTDSPLRRPTLFGGALVAQALRAAAATTDPAKYPHSLHASFVRGGQVGQDVEFQVTRTRDGRSFSNRQVVVSQGGRVLVTMTASFHSDEPSPEYQRPVEPTGPCPGDAPRATESPLGIDVVEAAEPDPARYRAWARSTHPLPADRALQACALAFMSDCGAPVVAASAIGLSAGGPERLNGDGPMTTSLDHAMWFHRASRCDDWMLISAIPLSTAGSRGLVLGAVHDWDGRHLASFTQELLIRA